MELKVAMKIKSLDEIEEESSSHNKEIRKKVLVRNGEIPGVTQVARVVLKTGQVAPSHTHSDMYEVFFGISGSGLMIVDNKEYKLESGVCITIEAGELHEVRNNGEENLVINIFGVEVAK